jgi:hypothetical protein
MPIIAPPQIRGHRGSTRLGSSAALLHRAAKCRLRGQSRRFHGFRVESGLPQIPDVIPPRREPTHEELTTASARFDEHREFRERDPRAGLGAGSRVTLVTNEQVVEVVEFETTDPRCVAR